MSKTLVEQLEDEIRFKYETMIHHLNTEMNEALLELAKLKDILSPTDKQVSLIEDRSQQVTEHKSPSLHSRIVMAIQSFTQSFTSAELYARVINDQHKTISRASFKSIFSLVLKEKEVVEEVVRFTGTTPGVYRRIIKKGGEIV